MRDFLSILTFGSFASLAFGKVYFQETFDDSDDVPARWVISSHKDDYGKWIVSNGKFYADATESKGTYGLKTSQDARFYSIAAPLDSVIDSSKTPFVFQFSAKNEQGIDCGGGYFKLLFEDADPKDFNGETPYAVMFGPDICGSSSRTHAILSHKGKGNLISKDIRTETDQLTHVYTFILNPDHTFKVLINGKEETSGLITEKWDLLGAKTIKDPEAKKPSDWVDTEMMDDPEDKKPADWGSAPQYIDDPEATKPEDWDDEMDGEFEAPRIQNPEWKGEWSPKRIKNPAYKGPWVHPEIANPEYVDDPSVGHYKIGFVGIDIWQVKSGTIFDDILVTDSEEEAADYIKKHIAPKQLKEKAAKEKLDEEERKKAEEEAAKSVPPPAPADDESDIHDEL